ncbi:MAG TPA: MFS transporter [Actinospica sp.]|jgi:predicted MFS family arabinose efflux permease|nr:MFS transporter [Actinospica sp.]
MRRISVLTLGSFTLGLDAYVVAGLLPPVAQNLHTTVSAAGQMVTVFTLAYALLSPVCATLLAARPIKAVLLLALALFVAGNVLGAAAGSLGVLLASRAVAGIGAGLYAPMAAAAAAGLAGPQRRGRALAMIVGGMSVGTALGVPLGLVLAAHAGWRATLWLIAGIGLLAMTGIALMLPRVSASTPSLRARVGVLTDRRVLSVSLITLCCSGTSIGMYTYVAPFFAHTLHTTHLAQYLWLWGLGGMTGSLVIGRLLDSWRDTRLLLTLILGVQGAVLALLPVAAGTPAGAAVCLFAWGVVGWGTLAPQQHRLLSLPGVNGPVAVSLNASALYLGSALGAGLGGILLGGTLAVATLPLVFGLAALVAAAANAVLTPASRAGAAEPAREERVLTQDHGAAEAARDGVSRRP